jgi:methionine-gamma-lyase
MDQRPLVPSDGLVKDPYGAHEPPIYQTSTFVFEHAADVAAAFAGETAGYVYTRINNPTVAAWEQKLAALESAGTGIEAWALAFGSGMGAATAAILACVRQGDHVVGVRPLYGGTTTFLLDWLPRFGVRTTQTRAGDLAGLEAAVRTPRTTALVIETPANPTLDIVDIRHAAEVAHANGARLVVDNTFATPIFQQPLALGADLVVQSSTKYLGGHGTVVGGGVVGRDKAFVAGPLLGIRKVFGSSPSPFDCWLLLQGVKTLELRVRRATETAGRLAETLVRHEMVTWLRYPGLADDPGHTLARKQMKGFGAMIAFGVRGGAEAGRRFMDALKVAKRAVSLGCTDTLIEHPASMTHAHLSAEELTVAGITADLIRVSVGIEDAAVITADILQALDCARTGPAVGPRATGE